MLEIEREKKKISAEHLPDFDLELNKVWKHEIDPHLECKWYCFNEMTKEKWNGVGGEKTWMQQIKQTIWNEMHSAMLNHMVSYWISSNATKVRTLDSKQHIRSTISQSVLYHKSNVSNYLFFSNTNESFLLEKIKQVQKLVYLSHFEFDCMW